jgi:hypothetical protein
MEDLQERVAKLRDDAEDCAIISKLATDPTKRETFARLAIQLRQMARDVEKTLADQARRTL